MPSSGEVAGEGCVNCSIQHESCVSMHGEMHDLVVKVTHVLAEGHVATQPN